MEGLHVGAPLGASGHPLGDLTQIRTGNNLLGHRIRHHLVADVMNIRGSVPVGVVNGVDGGEARATKRHLHSMRHLRRTVNRAHEERMRAGYVPEVVPVGAAESLVTKLRGAWDSELPGAQSMGFWDEIKLERLQLVVVLLLGQNV